MDKKRQVLLYIWALVMAGFPVGKAQATFPSMEIAHYEESITGDRKDPEYLLIDKLAKEKNYAAAMSLVEKKIQSSFNKSSAWMLKGMLLNEIGKYRQALTVRHGSILLCIENAFLTRFLHLGQLAFEDLHAVFSIGDGGCRLLFFGHRRFLGCLRFAPAILNLGLELCILS